MTKNDILKMTGLKEKDFYKHFPDEKSFIAKYGKQVKKLQLANTIEKAQRGFEAVKFNSAFPYSDRQDMHEVDNATPYAVADGGVNVPREPITMSPMLNMQQRYANSLDTKTLDPMKMKSVPKQPDYLAQSIPIVGSVIKGFQQLKDEKEEMRKAKQWKGVSDIQLQAIQSQDVDVNRNRFYNRFDNPRNIVTGEELFPTRGSGNTGIGGMARNGGEITSTYAPHTLYTDLEDVPKAESGFATFAKAGGTDMLNNLALGLSGGDSGGATLGGAAGDIVGMIPGVGPIAGMVAKPVLTAIGNLLDTNPEKTRRYQRATDMNVSKMMRMPANAYMEEGGNLTNPQLITHFGEHKLSDLLKRDPMMNTLRTGGQLKNNLLGGDLQVYKGGAEPISYNPYLPNGGETVMFRGPSHAEGGMNVSYGNTPVEVEGGEPATQMDDGGNISNNDSLIVWGNLKAPGYGGKKFKNIVKDISEKEEKQNRIMNKSTEGINDMNVLTPFDKLKVDAHAAMLRGADMKLKKFADEKQHLSALQNAINDTAEEYNLVADDLARGKVKQAKSGGKFTAEGGKFVPSSPNNNYKDMLKLAADKYGVDYNYIADLVGEESGFNTKVISDKGAAGIMQFKPDTAEIYGVKDILHSDKPEDVQKVIDAGVKHFKMLLDNNNNDYILATAAYNGGQGAVDFVKQELKKDSIAGDDLVNFYKNRRTSAPTKDPHAWQNETLDYVKKLTGRVLPLARSIGHKPTSAIASGNKDNILADWIASRDAVEQASYGPTGREGGISPSVVPGSTPTTTADNTTKYPWANTLMSFASAMLPYYRPSNVEPLDPRQIAGELSALSEKPDEVRAQLYHPQLSTPYDVVLPGKEDIIAQTRAAQRMAGYNPSAQSAIAAQSYAPLTELNTREFMANQEQKNRIYGQNRDIENQAQLQNLGILDTQYQRQEQAKSNTKAILRNALASIADKYQKNKLENRELATYENLYNYRFDKRGRAWNWNPPVQWNMAGNTGTTNAQGGLPKGWEYLYDNSGNIRNVVKVPKSEQTEVGTRKVTRNGAIVRAIKSL